MSRTVTVTVPQFWLLVGLICVTIAVANLGDAIGKAGRRVATACQVGQAPHAEARP